MKPAKSMSTSAELSFSDLTNFIREKLVRHENLAAISRADYNQLVLLEKEIFPDAAATFDASCIRHAVQYFDYAIIVGKSGGQIQSYLSFFPLTRNGHRYCIDNNVVPICHFPSHMFKVRRRSLASIFVEVIASRKSCP